MDEEQVPDNDEEKVSSLHEEKKESRVYCVLRFLDRPFIVALVSTVIFGVVVAKLGSCFQNENWKEQHKIAADSVKQEKLFDRRAEIFEKAIFLAKKREQNIWSFYSAKKESSEPLMWQCMEKAKNWVCETDMMIGEAKFCFGKHGKEMSQNFKNGFKIFHDLMYKLNDKNKDVKEEDIKNETANAIKILNKNSRFFEHYLAGKPLESPKKEGAKISETEYLYTTEPQFQPYDIDLSSGVTKYKTTHKMK